MQPLALALTWGLLVVQPVATAVSSEAFERVKQLEGLWKTDGKDGPVQYVAIRVVAGGSAVLETISTSDRMAVTAVTVYSFEGTELYANHHGPSGLSKLKVKEGPTLRFEGPKDSRLVSLSLSTEGARFREEWVTRESGREVRRSVELLREYVDTLK
jgi:hypothetical protein